MKIEFDEFIIEISPKEKGESLLTQITTLLNHDTVIKLFDRFADMVDVALASQMNPGEPLRDIYTLTEIEASDLTSVYGHLQAGTLSHLNTSEIRERHPQAVSFLKSLYSTKTPCEVPGILQTVLDSVVPSCNLSEITPEQWGFFMAFIYTLPDPLPAE